ncbi:Glyco-18 domain-containing protein [Mycena venus]|uniref:Glyco-18 domain-containing protein n=1 Tax=Mycena venus TaxID=2733690 RepID=A0A8H6YIY8_9AGAR|nr:Glyco-18 domain-containing protein [Mycena venus]
MVLQYWREGWGGHCTFCDLHSGLTQEHVFELGYINQFFDLALDAGISCTWYNRLFLNQAGELTPTHRIQNNVFNFIREDGSFLTLGLLNAIDTASNPFPLSL